MLILTFLSLGFAQMNDFYASIQGEDLCGRQFSEPRGMIKSIMHFGRKIGYKSQPVWRATRRTYKTQKIDFLWKYKPDTPENFRDSQVDREHIYRYFFEDEKLIYRKLTFSFFVKNCGLPIGQPIGAQHGVLWVPLPMRENYFRAHTIFKKWRKNLSNQIAENTKMQRRTKSACVMN